MTVDELIAKLQRYPGDTLVMLRDWNYVALNAETIEDVHIRKFEYKGRVWGEIWVENWDDYYEDRGAKVHASTEPVTGVLIS